MNLKENIQELLNKVNTTEELAVIFRAYKQDQGTIVYLPVSIVEGTLDENNLLFTSNNVKFNHLIDGPEEYGFAFSKAVTEKVKNNKYIPLMIQKKLMLKSLRNFYYIYAKDTNKNPILGVQSLNTGSDSDIDILYEDELLNYYIRKFPNAKDIINMLKKASGKLNLDVLDISEKLGETYSNKLQANQILTSIWKHYCSDESYNIFINGSKLTPKKEIVKSICESANIPYYFTSTVEDYEIINIEEMLNNLLKRSNNDLYLAENSVLIIDNIDKLAVTDVSADSFATAQLNLSKILKGEVIKIKINKYKSLNFDTSKMMIIGMGNFEDDEIKDIKINGFYSKNDSKKKDKDKYKYGMLEGLFDNFKRIIQMDEPNLQDYENCLINRENAGIINNTNFFNSLNIKLTVSEEVLSELANFAYKNKMSLTDISELIEKMLSNASFEIAKNPDIYEELVVTLDTIKDNKKYTLVRRKNNE